MLEFKTYINDENKSWITFLHGFGGSSNIWYKQIRKLSKSYNLLFIDLRGHGKSRNVCLDSDFNLNVNVDPNLIGGLKIQIGSQMIDSSIKNQLQLLKEKMKEVA